MKVSPPTTKHSRRTTTRPSGDNRRRTERVPTQFGLMYSGMHEGRMLIGNGKVNNVSQSGIGIHGNHLLKQGMDLSLFIDLPGVTEPVCIAETRVSWVSGPRFGVEIMAPKLDAHKELLFHVWNPFYPTPNTKSEPQGEP
jgi:hypothetical protein